MLIKTRRTLIDTIRFEKKIYCPTSRGGFLKLAILNDERYAIFKYLKLLRMEEFYLSSNSILHRLLRFICRARKNRKGNILGLKILPGCVGIGVNIHHRNVIINGHVGDYCIFHGGNCIGNNPKKDEVEDYTPTVGNNVEFGFGSIAIGNISIASNVVIGAGAVVVKTINEENSVWVGVPAYCKYVNE